MFPYVYVWALGCEVFPVLEGTGLYQWGVGKRELEQNLPSIWCYYGDVHTCGINKCLAYTDPATLKLMGEVPDMDEVSTARAIQSADEAGLAWSQTTGKVRFSYALLSPVLKVLLLFVRNEVLFCGACRSS